MLLYWFNGMTIISESESDDLPDITLTSAIVDRSALLSILFKIGYLNLALIFVIRIEMNSKNEAQVIRSVF
jgi:hypothetical protein